MKKPRASATSRPSKQSALKCTAEFQARNQGSASRELPRQIEGDPGASTAPARLSVEYDKILPLAQALSHARLICVNLDVPAVASMAAAVYERMQKHRAIFVQLPIFDMEAFDGLATAGQALALAHADYRFAITPPDPLVADITRAIELRGILQHAGETLADAGVIPTAQVAAMRGGSSHLEIASAMIGWTRVLLTMDWPAVKAHSYLTDELILEAQRLGAAIVAGTGRKQLDSEEVAAVTAIRQRMFTLTLAWYDEVRRGASFWRWHDGDVDTFVPSLYSKAFRNGDTSKRKARAKRGGETPAGDPTTSPVATPLGEPQQDGIPKSGPVAEDE